MGEGGREGGERELKSVYVDITIKIVFTCIVHVRTCTVNRKNKQQNTDNGQCKYHTCTYMYDISRNLQKSFKSKARKKNSYGVEPLGIACIHE